MNTVNEAFRIRLGSLKGERPLDLDHQRAAEYQLAVKKLLEPLRLADRLQFFRDFETTGSREWLVVKIEASKQLSLLSSLAEEVPEEPELARECDASLELIRDALKVLRTLSAAARMTPHEFHKILRRQSRKASDGLRLGRLADSADQSVLVRDPKGHDASAQAPVVPSRVTLAESQPISFRVNMLGKTSALVCPLKDVDGCARRSRKSIPLHWGCEADRADLFRIFLSALEEDREITTWARKTVNKSGKLMRLEWAQHPETLN